MLKDGELGFVELMLSTATAPNRTLGLLIRIMVNANTRIIAVWKIMKAAMYAKHFLLFLFPSPFDMIINW